MDAVRAFPHWREQIPVQLTSFIGRAQELSEVLRLLASTRLLTLTGAGGCGKTRLATEVAAEVGDTFADGVCWVDLAPLSDLALVPQSIADALGIKEVPAEPLAELLSNYLSPKYVLLVLDNCEHLLRACAEIAERLLIAAPRLKILVTSREPFGLAGETAWLVPSLSMPHGQSALRDGPDSKATLLQFDAPHLFVERAAAVAPTFSVTNESARAIVQVCQRVDGIPLAIELAAAWVRVLTVEQILARLDDRFALLTAGNRTAVIPRHRTLRAAIDWSYDLLTEAEQMLFRQLSVFAGGFSLEAAESVCAVDGLERARILDLVTELVDKSMVVAETAGHTEARYHLLETIRQYAGEKLDETSDSANAHNRHLDYLCQVAEEGELKLRSAEQLVWLQRLELDHDNFRAALSWSLDSRRIDIGLRTAGALYRFWEVRGYWTEGQRWLLDLLARAETRANIQVARANFSQSTEDARRRVKALYGAGMLAFYKRDVSAERALLEKSLELAQEIEDAWWIALCLSQLNGALIFAGTLAAARPALEESVRLARGTGDKWLLAICLAYLGHSVRLQAYEAALPIFEESITLAREAGDRITLSEALFVAANAALGWKKFERAAELAQELVLVTRQIGRRFYDALGLYILGGARFAEGRSAEAVALVSEALALARASEEPRIIAIGLVGLATIVTALGQMQRAAHWFGVADALLRRAGIELNEWAAPGTSLGPLYRESIALVHAQLGEAAFAEAMEEGKAMTTEQAIEEALSVASELLRQGESVAEGELKPRAELTILSLGPVEVYVNGQLLASSAWTYAKSRELLLYLLSRATRTKAQIGLDLWPDDSPSQLRSNLGVKLHYLRRALGRPEWIKFEQDHYSFDRSLNYWFDVEAFESHLVDARRLRDQAPAQAIEHLEAAVELYRGDFMEDWLEGEWFSARREELRRMYLEALLTLGGLLFEKGDYATAAGAYRRAIAHDNYLEAAHRELMRCYTHLGEPGQALRHYEGLVELLRAELGSPPAAETTALFERLRRGEAI